MYSESYIREIFSSFADSQTELIVRSSKVGGFLVELIVSGNRKSFIISSDGKVQDKDTNVQYYSFASLLSSDSFSKLDKYCSAQLRVLKEKNAFKPLNPKIRILSNSSIINNNISIDDSFSDFFDELLNPVRESEKIKIIILDGPAGMGKTHFIERLTYEYAKKYKLRESNSPLVLHVSSRGRRLSKFDDVVAATIQDFKSEAGFYYQQIPTLVRENLLILAIDGFDELADSDGYRNAWSLLNDFLSQISKNGICILAGRDTFFDQNDLVKRFNSSENIEFIQLRLENINLAQAKTWLLEKRNPAILGGDGSSLKPSFLSLLESEEHFLRPYFISELSKLDEKTYDLIEQESYPKEFLIKRFIEREAKIVESTLIEKGMSSNVIYERIKNLMLFIASDMTEREVNEIDGVTLLILLELVFEDVLNKDDINKLKHKIKSMAFLEIINFSEDKRSFPHETIQYYFSSLNVVNDVLQDCYVNLLHRSVISLDFLESFQDVFLYSSEITDENAISFVKKTIKKLESESSGDRFRQNSISLLFLCLSRMSEVDFCDSLLLSDTYVSDVLLDQYCSNKKLSIQVDSLFIDRLHVLNSNLESLCFKNTIVNTLVANDYTGFGEFYPNVKSIYLVDNKEYIRDPVYIANWISSHSKSTASNRDVNNDFFDFFVKVCTIALQKKYLRPKTDIISKRLVSNKYWEYLEIILGENGRIDIEKTAEVYKIIIDKPGALLKGASGTPEEKIIKLVIDKGEELNSKVLER